jgi:hypothetical protein
MNASHKVPGIYERHAESLICGVCTLPSRNKNANINLMIESLRYRCKRFRTIFSIRSERRACADRYLNTAGGNRVCDALSKIRDRHLQQRSANNAECACVPSHSAGYLSDAHRHAEERDVSVHACVLASVSVHACALRHAEQRTDVVVSCSFSVASLYD